MRNVHVHVDLHQIDPLPRKGLSLVKLFGSAPNFLRIKKEAKNVNSSSNDTSSRLVPEDEKHGLAVGRVSFFATNSCSHVRDSVEKKKRMEGIGSLPPDFANSSVSNFLLFPFFLLTRAAIKNGRVIDLVLTCSNSPQARTILFDQAEVLLSK